MPAAAAATVVAVDVGASSGRVMLARVGPDILELREAHRFAVHAVPLPTGLTWDALGIFREILHGLRVAGRSLADGERIASVGVDTWAVDYGLISYDGSLLGPVRSHRDPPTAAVIDRVHRIAPPGELYARTGLRHLPFHTRYQLAAEQGTARWAVADQMLLLPDLIAYWLTGEVGAEITNASTTGLLDARGGRWDVELAGKLDIPAHLLPPLRRPGDAIGHLLPAVVEATGLPAGTPVVAVGSHDTASAVLAAPAAAGDRFAYLSSGTWSLLGLELTAPVLTEDSREADFTNERGVDDTIGYLRNVGGLWLLDESVRHWRRTGVGVDVTALLVRAAVLETGAVIDVDDPVFVPPGDMPGRIADWCRRTGQPVPATPPELARCVLDSLAVAYQCALEDAVTLAGREVDVLYVVGGGSRNEVLCQLTADATGLPVTAGPVEATALGNALVQARALGVLDGDRWRLRDLVRATQHTTRYAPRH